MKKTYRSIFISDIHLGSKDCKASQLTHFLKNNTAQTIYLVGDIIDGWKIQKNRLKWKQSHSDVIRQILKHSKQNTEVIYIIGNHDEFIRPFLHYNLEFASLKFCNQATHVGIDGKSYLVVHGDLFDGITRLAPWISFLGDWAYDAVLSLNSKLNWLRYKFGFGYWSLSKYLKVKVKKSIDFIFQFEKNLATYCKKRDFDGVICGHIHHAEIKNIDGVVYMNDGDWVESLTALVEHHTGVWEIIHWTEIEKVKVKVKDEEKNIDSN